MARTQEFRQLAVATPLGQDVLLLRRISGAEQLGRPFEYELELLSEDANIPLADLVGQNVTVRVQMSPEGEPRYFNGYVSRFALDRPLGKTMEYRATIVPWLWFLTRTSDCRIFQNMTVPEIAKQVFREHGFTDVEDRLIGGYRKWEYCVQYNETDFSFVSRLMEQEAIFYYFQHENGKHTLVLANASSTHDSVPGYEEVPYLPPTTSLREREYIRQWTMEQQVQPGVYSHTDFDFQKPEKQLLASAKVARSYATPDFEIFEYPGEYCEVLDGEAYARRRIEEYQAEYEVARGQGEVRGITTGRRFVLTGHPRADQCKRYLVTGTTIEATSDRFGSGAPAGPGESGTPAPAGAAGARGANAGANYAVRFTAIDIYQPFRPRRITPRPLIRGPQTAIVVGPKGEEIYTDKYGRVKVQFHWDRHSEANENSSCWVRVAQHWAGRKWGTMFIPRIGHEVIVEFLEGDPDRPIITGRVYNDATRPPYDLPAHATMSTIKTLSSKGGGGFNEIRFEDRKGEEQVFIHAEKNQDVRVRNDCFEWIGNDRHLIVKRDQIEQADGDKHLTVKGNRNEKVEGTISVRAGQDWQQDVGTNTGVHSGKQIHIHAGTELILEAGTQISLKVGGNFVDIGPSGITIEGTSVRICCGGVAGIGMGCLPESPKLPTEAAQAEPGEVSEPPPTMAPPKPTEYCSQAAVLKQAAVDGTPFCEVCAKAVGAQEHEPPSDLQDE